ncbi:MAG: protein translocase subunit SecF [Dongiaceae bacterium]
MRFHPLHLVPPDTKIDFMRWHKLCFVFSLVITIVSVASIATRGFNFGIDFAGGILIEVKAQAPAADLGAMRAKLDNLGLGEVALQEFGSPDTVLVRIQRQQGDEGAQQRAVSAVKTALGSGYDYRRTEFVGPKVGSELVQTALIAVGLALLGIALYIWFRYEWQFGVNAIVATFHDCITAAGLFSLFQIEFNLTTVAAILTIAGYSVNDTVVVYDRIRAELRKYKKMPVRDILNLSINKTLSRTTVTSALTLLSVVALYLFGGEVIRGFALAMIWGICIGTYSTIFVASPMLIYMHLRRNAGDAKAAPEPGLPADAGQAGQ